MPGLVIIGVGIAALGYALFSPYRAVLGFRAGKPFILTVRKIGKLTNGDDGWLQTDAADAFEAMRDAAARAGVQLRVSSAFRTWAEQAALKVRNMFKSYPTADPGYSNHQQGTTLDLDVNGYDSAEVQGWLKQNAALFGFYRTVPSENWHFEWTAGNA